MKKLLTLIIILAALREKLSEALHALGYDSVVVNVTFKANPQGR